MSVRFAFALENLSPLGFDKRFAAMEQQYTQKAGLSYLSFTFHGTAPWVNRKGMAITYPTHKNSVASAVDSMLDYEHEVEDLPTPSDDNNVVGHICSLYVDDADVENLGWIVDGIIPREPVITRGVMALYTRIHSVDEIVRAIAAKRETWFFSLEVGKEVPQPEIWLYDDGGSEILSWEQAPDDLRAAASQPREAVWNDKKIAYLMGGRDGIIPYIGGAITQFPAGREQNSVPGNQLKFICNMADPDADAGDMRISVYSDISEVPSRLKTMDGVPLTLDQINGIVRQAEAIEREGKATNGWAVAKAHFKDTHVVRDGRWVKREAKKAAGLDSEDAADGDKETAAVWTTAYKNDLPDSSFAVIEGNYKSGKTDDKNCRHLPFRDKNGKVDLVHLQKAFQRLKHIKAVSGPESTEQLQAKARSKLEPYRKYLKSAKEAASDDQAFKPEDFAEVNITSLQDLLRMADAVGDIISDQEGGTDMPLTMEQEELDAQLEAARKGAVTAAIEAGEVVRKEDADKLFSQEQVDAMVKEGVIQKGRQNAIAALELDEETAAEYTFLAMNAELYPLDDDGEEKFNAAVKRWSQLRSKDGGSGDAGGDAGDGADKRQASMGNKGQQGKDFDPGRGSAGGKSDNAKVVRFGTRG